jgi:predicted dehydrogenase
MVPVDFCKDPVPMTTLAHVRLGIIGVGSMGSHHVDNLLARKVPRCDLQAVCDIDTERLAKYPTLRTFTDSSKLIRSGLVDAVLIATPHYAHTTIGIDALTQGLHVLSEKPLSVHKADCERLIQAYRKRPKKSQVFAAMFQTRTEPAWIKLRQLIRSGELGEIRRLSWTVTDWFRSQAYYASGDWRATWRGEGGGVLINQCPHNLDLLQWLFGMPSRVRGFCGLGKWHAIETEDAVTAYLEYPNGATGVFITTTGEAPGSNRLEIAAEYGRVVLEHGKLLWERNTTPMSEFSRTTTGRFDRPETWNVEIPATGHAGHHVAIIHNFVDAILDGKPLIAEAVDGINSVELGNAMLLSSLLDKTLSLPLDSAMVEREFAKLIKRSSFGKRGGKRHGANAPGADEGLDKSFANHRS